MLFSRLDVTRAYIYFFDDKDEPQIHGSSGLTRNGQPKPAFHAVAHLFKTLGDYRFRRVVQEKPGNVFVFEFAHGDDLNRRVWTVWSPTGSGKKGRVDLKTEPQWKLLRAEQMPLESGDAPAVHPKVRQGTLSVDSSESPVFLEWSRARDEVIPAAEHLADDQ